MTRFARSEKTKTSKKRALESATPWDELKISPKISKSEELADSQPKKKKRKSSFKENDDPSLSQNCSTVNIQDEKDIDMNTDIQPKKKKKKSSSNNNEFSLSENCSAVNIQDEEDFDGNFLFEDINENTDIKPKKKKRKSSLQNKETNQSLHDEDDVDGSFETDKSMSNVNGSTSTVNTQGKIKKSMKVKKAKDNKKSKNKKEKQVKKTDYTVIDGVRYKITKDGKKRPWFDLLYEENDYMTVYTKFFVKKEDIEHLNNFKKALKKEGFSTREIEKKVFTRERRAHNKLRIELMRQQIQTIKENKSSSFADEKNAENIEKGLHKAKISKRKKHKEEHAFQENDLMTQFDGWWVLKSRIPYLNNIVEQKQQEIISSRTDGNNSEKLTEEELVIFNRQMKKIKRSEHHFLRKELALKSMKTRKFNKKHDENSEDSEKVKFQGYFVKSEGAERLNELKNNLENKGCSSEEINNVMRTERRKEERVLKRESKLICFNCREPGHTVAQCSQNKNINACFKCGSTEHMARDCKTKGSFTHASCFYCNETGHIARECPDNPKKLYPKGGGCRQCGSVEHFRRDCPDFQKKKKEDEIAPKVLQSGGDLDF